MQRRIAALEADPRSSRADLSEAWRGLAYAYFFQQLYSNAEHSYTKALEWQLECVPPNLIQVARLKFQSWVGIPGGTSPFGGSPSVSMGARIA